MSDRRRVSIEALRCWLARGVADFYATILHGMSVQARDGADPAALRQIADNAMKAWDRLV